MPNRVKSAGLVAALALAAGGAVLSAAPAANADTTPPWYTGPGGLSSDTNNLGGLAFFSAAGNQITGGNLSDLDTTYVAGNTQLLAGNTKATLYANTPTFGSAPGTWPGEQLSLTKAFPNASAPAPLNTSTLPVVSGATTQEELADYIGDVPNQDTTHAGYIGVYELRLKTSQPTTSNLYDSAVISVNTGAGTWSLVYTPAGSQTATTTTLTTSPASPQVAGTPVQLNAAVSPAAAGTVQFEDGSTAIGSPVTVTAGAASITTSTLSAGSHSLHAVFTPAALSGYAGSTGDASFTVNAAPATQTVTALAVPLDGPAYSATSLTATVTKQTGGAALTAGDGSVTFYENGTTALGTASLTGAGTATVSVSTFGAGVHHLTATFTPNPAVSPAVYATSSSTSQDFTATAPLFTPDDQTVKVTVDPGTLTIATPYTPSNPFNLGHAQLDPAAARFVASAPFGTSSAGPTSNDGGVTIVDTRPGNLAWHASVTATDFTDGATPAHTINSQNLSFHNLAAHAFSGNAFDASASNLTLTPATSAADTVANGGTDALPYGTSASGNDGLKGAHDFADVLHGYGSVDIDGTLTLNAPTSTLDGTYTSTLTFTIAG